MRTNRFTIKLYDEIIALKCRSSLFHGIDSGTLLSSSRGCCSRTEVQELRGGKSSTFRDDAVGVGLKSRK